MKASITTLFLLAASAIAQKVSYAKAKAIRIEVGEDVTPVFNAISKLKLETWKGIGPDGLPIAGGHVDLVVPASKLAQFSKLTKGITQEVMHEDLGLSIAEESSTPALTSRGMSKTRTDIEMVY